MEKIRIRYSKTGKAGYISHLDLMTTMQRALIRAGVSLKYTEGFNPHPYMSVALPASVGIESMCEIMDISLNSGGIPQNINSFLPEGLQILKSYRPWRNTGEIKWLDLEGNMHFCEIPPPALAEELSYLFSAKNLVITKKTKRGTSEIDIAPYIQGFHAECCPDDEQCIRISIRVSAQNPTVSSKDITCIVERFCFENNIKYFSNITVKRIEIFDADMVLFK